MTMKNSLREQRKTAIDTARAMIDRVKAEGRDLTPDEIKSLESQRDTIKSLAARIDAADAGRAAIDDIGALTPEEEAYGIGAAGAKGDRHLNLKGLGADLVQGMTAASRAVNPNAKGLVPAGETIVSVPLVSSTVRAGGAQHERSPRLVDVLRAVQRSAPVYDSIVQTVIADAGAAGVVAAGGVKPTKRFGIERVNSRLRVIAVLSEPVDKYLLEDASNLRAWVQTELAVAVADALETEVLTGDGTGDHFLGLANTSGIQLQPFEVDRITTLAGGLSKLSSLGLDASFVALSPADWLGLQTHRNAGGNFDLGGPIDATAQTVWGARVVVVPGLATGDGYIVGEDSLTLSTDTAGVRAEWGTPGDAFTRNEVVARVEGRFNLDVEKPHGIVRLDLTAS